MMLDNSAILEYLEDHKALLKKEVAVIDSGIRDIVNDSPAEELAYPHTDGDSLFKEICSKLGYNPNLKGSEFYTIKHPNPIMYLIQPSVHKCAEMIKIADNFSCSIFKTIKDGSHYYLLGKNEFFQFVKFNGVIRGSFWNRERHVAFEVGFHLNKDRYYFPYIETSEFNRIVRLMTFIELGDIETVFIQSGHSNNKTKKEGKITNTSDYSVFVVDSSWNKLSIRTDGFAVMGHFRLQPCGSWHLDRKLIWIDAFEKHGYKRSPRASIAK